MWQVKRQSPFHYGQLFIRPYVQGIREYDPSDFIHLRGIAVSAAYQWCRPRGWTARNISFDGNPYYCLQFKVRYHVVQSYQFPCPQMVQHLGLQVYIEHKPEPFTSPNFTVKAKLASQPPQNNTTHFLKKYQLQLTMSRDPLVVGNVVGDILDPFIKSASLRVLYSNRELTNGSELKPSQVANEPRIEIAGRDMRTLYTLVSS